MTSDVLTNGEGEIGRLDELCMPDMMNHALGPNGRRGIEATRELLKKPRRGRWAQSHVIAERDDLTMLLQLGALKRAF